jgi:hypothetical protein
MAAPSVFRFDLLHRRNIPLADISQVIANSAARVVADVGY